MSDQEFKYDVFLSYASEDTEWCERLAERLRDKGVTVWFDKWELKPGDNLLARINQGLKQKRKMITVFSRSYFRDDKVWTRAEIFSQQHPDVLTEDRPLIPVLIEDCEIEPTLRGILHIDFRNPDDFELRLRQLVEALDLPRLGFQFRDRDEFEFREHKLDPASCGRRNYALGKRFEDEVATLYRLLGFDAKQDINLSGMQIDLTIEQKIGGLCYRAIVECKDKQITARERDQILAQRLMTQQKLPAYGTVAVSAQGFAAETPTALEAAGVHCITYAELLRDLVPLDNYADRLIAEYETWMGENWNNEDWFIRPDVLTDIVYEHRPALAHIAKWRGDTRSNLLVILGDLGTGKSTLSRFLAYNLARSFREDPLRHPAPVLIPLKDVRKETSLEGIVISHFSRHGLPGINFPRFEHLLRLGKVLLLFDAFDEMAERVRSEVTSSNFRELRRAAEQQGKVILTCRTHYFKDRTEQVKVIGEGPRLSELETELYRDLRRQSSAEVVYLQEFDDAQIQAYLTHARPQTAQADWQTIQDIWNLKELAQRPLMLDMIVKSLRWLEKGQDINAASLYTIYTNRWIEREIDKDRKPNLDIETRLALMLELAWRMWHEEKEALHYSEFVPFVEKLKAGKLTEFGDELAEDIAREMQTATFLKRNDAGQFTFAHRSFMEFFLARKLYVTLTGDDPQAISAVLDTRRFDRKTIYFLTLLDAQPGNQDRIIAPLQPFLTDGYRSNVSENALQLLYWSGRIGCEMEDEIKDHIALRAALARRIPASVKLPGAKLSKIELEDAPLDDADFSGADLTEAKLHHALLQRVSFRAADIREAVFNDAVLTASDFAGVQNQEQASFIDVRLKEVKGLVGKLAPQTLSPRVQPGHSVGVNSVAISPDGNLCASGDDNGLILIHNVSDGHPLRALEGHSQRVNSLAFAPDGQMLASASDDRSVRLWQVSDWQRLRVLEGHRDVVNSVAFSPDGQTLASASADRSVRLWQVSDWQRLRTLGKFGDGVSSVAFAPDGQMLASASADSFVRLWQVSDGKRPHVLKGHGRRVSSVAFAPDGLTLASASDDRSVRLWQVSSGQLLHLLEGHEDCVRSVAFAPDGRTLASASNDDTVRLWQVSDGKTLHILKGRPGAAQAVAFASNSKYLVVAGTAGRLRFWDYENGKTFLHRYSFGPGAWLDLLPDGRFNASPEGMRYLSYTGPGSTPGQVLGYRAEELVKEFYHPEDVRAVLAKYTT